MTPRRTVNHAPIWVAVIAAVAPTLAALFTGCENGRKLDAVHVLVNSRLSEALDEIKTLRGIVSTQGTALDSTRHSR